MSSLLWISATLAAAAAQTVRNATQRRLTETLGTAGATQVRFLYGLPFALLFLSLVAWGEGGPLPAPDAGFLAFALAGAVAQILATALMLAAMRERSFSVVTAIIKTEPVQVALFGLAVLGDPLGPSTLAAVLVATAGVVLISFKAGLADLGRTGQRPVALGVLAGSFFALAAVAFRGAITSLDQGSFLLRASLTLAWALGLQTGLLLAWLLATNRRALAGSIEAWRASLLAGFLGALASQFWFIAFALTTAANVRTLALVEVVFAQVVAHRFLAQATSRQELAGMALIGGGVALLLWGQA